MYGMTTEKFIAWDQPDFMTPSLAGAVLSARRRSDGKHHIYTGKISGRRRQRFSMVKWCGVNGLLLCAFRGQVVLCWMDYSSENIPQVRGVPANDVEPVALPAARLLGAMKSGVKERPSKMKAASSRRNGASPCRPGRRRGRPRKCHMACGTCKVDEVTVAFDVNCPFLELAFLLTPEREIGSLVLEAGQALYGDPRSDKVSTATPKKDG